MDRKLRFGSQIYGFDKELTADIKGMFCSLAEMGYTLLEPLLVLREKQLDGPMNFWAFETFEKAVKLTAEAGLTMESAHISCPLDSDPQAIADLISKVTAISTVRFFVFGGMFRTAADAQKWAALLNSLLPLIPDGVTLLYHPHGDEFTKIPMEEREGCDVYAMDTFFRYADKAIGFEPDFGWSYFASVPFEDMKKYADRIRLIHLKDFMAPGKKGLVSETDENSFPAIGEGNAYNKEVFDILDELPGFVGNIIIDQDHYPAGMLLAMKIGYANVQSWLKDR